jgi:hypothetical protein
MSVLASPNGRGIIQARSLVPRSVHIIAFNAFLLGDMLFTSRVYRVFGDAIAQPVVLAIMAGVSIFYAVMAFFEGKFLPLLLFVGTVGLLINQLNVFSEITYSPVNFNSAFQHIAITTFIVFSMVSRAGLRDYMMNQLALFATAYSIFYTLAAVANFAGAVPPALLEAITITDIERGGRLFSYAAATAFAWFYWLYRFRSVPSMTNLALMIVCALAIILSLSRVFILFVTVITLLSIVTSSKLTVRAVCLGALCAVSAVYFYGMLDQSWNPFKLLTSDSSGLARSLEYETIRYLLWQNPITGVGIPSVQTEIERLTGNFFFAAGDLGALGPWFDFGFYGLVLFFLGSFIATLPPTGIDDSFAQPLFLTGCMMAGYGCIAPVLFLPGGSTYFVLLLGLWLDRRGSSPLSAANAPASSRHR